MPCLACPGPVRGVGCCARRNAAKMLATRLKLRRSSRRAISRARLPKLRLTMGTSCDTRLRKRYAAARTASNGRGKARKAMRRFHARSPSHAQALLRLSPRPSCWSVLRVSLPARRSEAPTIRTTVPALTVRRMPGRHVPERQTAASQPIVERLSSSAVRRRRAAVLGWLGSVSVPGMSCIAGLCLLSAQGTCVCSVRAFVFECHQPHQRHRH